MSRRAQPCKHCGQTIVIHYTRRGIMAPFVNDLVEADAADEHQLHVPMPGPRGIVMVPVSDVKPRRLEGVRWFALKHYCRPYLIARQRDREEAERHELANAMHDVLSRSTRVDD